MKIDRVYPATTESLPEASAFLEDLLDEHSCPMKEKMQLCIAFEEIFVNVASYAYPDAEGSVEISLEIEQSGCCSDCKASCLTLTFSDSGIPFDPLAKPDPDVTLSLEERQIGGLGIYMVKKSMDDMAYEFVDGKNVLTVKKTF